MTESLIPEAINCDTKTFWQKMCSPGFVRLGLNHGAIGADYFYTEQPPELVPGFLENVIDSIGSSLNIKCLSGGDKK